MRSRWGRRPMLFRRKIWVIWSQSMLPSKRWSCDWRVSGHGWLTWDLPYVCRNVREGRVVTPLQLPRNSNSKRNMYLPLYIKHRTLYRGRAGFNGVVHYTIHTPHNIEARNPNSSDCVHRLSKLYWPTLWPGEVDNLLYSKSKISGGRVVPSSSVL